MLVTSISLPANYVALWRLKKRQIMQFGARYLRICMRQQLRRGVMRRYNRGHGQCQIVTARFTAAEYDSLHAVAAALRVSVSSLVFGIIKLWQKPSRHCWPWEVASNYDCRSTCWRPYAGFVEEDLLFLVLRKPLDHRQLALTVY